MAYHWPGNVRELVDFVNLVKCYKTQICARDPKMGGVPSWLTYDRFKNYRFHNRYSCSGVLRLEPFFKVRASVRDAGGGLIEHVDRYAPLLAMRGNRSETVSLGDTEEGNFTDLKSISVGEASEAKNKEVNNIVDSNESRKETQLEMFFRQWGNWCGLFFQDPYSNKDIIECIMEKEATKIPVDEYEHNDLYFDPEYGELAYRIYDIMYDEPKDSAQTISPRSIAPESQTKSDALNFVLKRVRS